MQTPQPIRPYRNIFATISAAFIIVGLISLTLWFISQNPAIVKNDPEIILGLVIVLGLTVLVLMLFIMTSGFWVLNLDDPQQPIGLPAGSIQAMIALLLILIWVIVSIFLFINTGFLDTNATQNVDAIKLGQQFYTTMSTLVVAISAFYFGSRTAQAAQRVQAPSPLRPQIVNINPPGGPPGQSIPNFIIKGNNFQSPTSVKLVSGSEEIPGTGILSNDTTIQCTIQIPTTAKVGDKWMWLW